MKKLLFATAIAASAAAFADPINAISFEDANYTPGTTFANGDAEYNEFGAANTNYFFFAGEAGVSNSSVVTNESPSIDKRTAYFAELAPAATNKYLALDTEGGTFWRGINGTKHQQDGEDHIYSLGDAEAVGAGIYLDTLVQFTVTEDEEPSVGNEDKLAIWLGVETNSVGEVTTTNLMVKAGLTDDQGGITETTFKLNGTVNPGEWYRLTVKALADITDGDGIPGFQIYLDGTLLTSSTPTLTSEYLELLGPDEGSDDSHYADLVAGKYFASLKTATTLQGVGFQGTGAVDEIVWTTEDPIAGGSGLDFTLWVDEVIQVFTGTDVSAAEKEKIAAWMTANSITKEACEAAAERAAAAYLFNLDSLPDAVPELTITSITEGKDAQDNDAWILTVAASVTANATTSELSLPQTINGVITLRQAAELSNLDSATPTTTGFTATVNGTVTVTITKDPSAATKFMRVGVGLAPASNE